MALRLELAQRQTQKLILSPQMQQAIHILQLPIMDLRTLAIEELAVNPVLEEAKDGEAPRNDNTEVEKDGEVEFKEEFDKLLQLDNEWRDYFRQVNTIRKSTPEEEEKRRYFEDSITADESLQDFLLRQLRQSAIARPDIAEHIIGNIDARGYLLATLEEIAAASAAPVEEVERTLRQVQLFDPPGIGARDLKECLRLQLERSGAITPVIQALIDNHLEDLSKKKYPFIAKKLKVGVADIQRIATLFAQLEPKPGRFFSQEKTHYIIADVIVQKVDGQYVVLLNNERIPHLRISSTYRKLMTEPGSSDTDRQYIRDKLKSGMWFIKNILQRQKTIQNIATQIVEEQKAFLEEGITALRPMTMQQIADKLGIHESTVSRAIANKYMLTPQGLFAMKYFFTTAIETFSGHTVSSENAKEAVANLVRGENPKQPLSDQEIVKILSEQNIKLARRTVAKYRKELNILPSNMRKSF